MVKRALIIICFVLLSVTAKGKVIAGEENKVLKVYYFHRPPYYVRLDDGKATGFLVEITKMILDTAGISHVFVETPPKRILKFIEHAEYSCSVGWFKTRERESVALFSDPIYQDMPAEIVSRRSSSLFTEKPTLNQVLESPLTLGVVKGFSYGSDVDDAILRLNPSIFSISGEAESLLKMIQYKRIDYAFMAPEESNYILQQNPLMRSELQLIKIADVTQGNFRYLMFSKGVGSAVVERVNESIRKVKNTEKYRDLISVAKQEH